MLTAAEIAAVIGISSSAVRQIVRRHEIRSCGKIGRAKLYRYDSVAAFARKIV